MSLLNLGDLYALLANHQRAAEHYKSYLPIARRLGDRHGEGLALGNLGVAHAELGNAA